MYIQRLWQVSKICNLGHGEYSLEADQGHEAIRNRA